MRPASSPPEWRGDKTVGVQRQYRKRNVVERCTGRRKDCRALGARFDKLAVSFLGTIHLAIIRLYLYLRLLDSSDRA